MGKLDIKKRFKESIFLRVLNIIRKNKDIYIYTIVLDLIFLSLTMFIGKYIGSFIPADTQQMLGMFKNPVLLLLFIIFYPILYYVSIVFVYSVVKLIVLNLVRSLYEKSLYENEKFGLKGLGRFYLLNLLILVIFFFGGLALLGVLSLIFKMEFLRYILFVLLVPFLFFLYSTINISHTLFFKAGRKKVLKKSFVVVFNKIKKYGMFLTWDVMFVLIYFLVYNIIHLFFRAVIFSNEAVLASYGELYIKIFNIVSLVVVYTIIAFNRIYFYEGIGKNVLP